MSVMELPIDSNFNIKNSSNDVIGTLVTAGSTQTWSWDKDKVTPWPAENFKLEAVSASGLSSLGPNTDVYSFTNNTGFIKGSATITAPYYKVEVSHHRRFRYDAAQKWLFWISSEDATLSHVTMDVHYKSSGSHTSEYHRTDDAI